MTRSELTQIVPLWPRLLFPVHIPKSMDSQNEKDIVESDDNIFFFLC
jgi:hypothetical protein